MNADNFRHAFEYHFMTNRKLWDQSVMALTDAQFVQPLDYSIGSIRNQTVHMFNVDDRWFCGLLNLPVPDFVNPEDYPDRALVREMWDAVEQRQRLYLDDLTDDMLQQEFRPGILVWQVLLHNINHGTDHRAQVLAMLHSLGAPTFAQDYMYYVMGRL